MQDIVAVQVAMRDALGVEVFGRRGDAKGDANGGVEIETGPGREAMNDSGTVERSSSGYVEGRSTA